jgi:nitrogen fixation protein NifQ
VLAGLSGSEHRRLLARWFPGAELALALDLDWLALARAPRREARQDEIEDLVDLLTDTAAVVPPGLAGIGGGTTPGIVGNRPTHGHQACRWLAHALGQASLGDNHLWQDLHLPSRREVSVLMSSWFPALAAGNDRDMKWKKLLYKQLCDHAEIKACRAPSCSGCSDYARCFGPEDAVAA